MAKYLYTARNAAGKPMSGEIDAKDERDLAAQLRANGFIVTSMRSRRRRKKSMLLKSSIAFKG